MNTDVIACTLREAQERLGESTASDARKAPDLARRLRKAGTPSVCIVDVQGDDGFLRTWIDTGHAQGWLSAASTSASWMTPGKELFAAHLADAMARGFVVADAAVLAAMATYSPGTLPLLSWDEEPAPVPAMSPSPPRRLDLYAIVDSAERIAKVLAAGIRTVQLRIKRPEHPSEAWHDMLRGEVKRGVAACEAAGAELFVNDHWQIAADSGARGVHLGQEDLLALGASGRAALRATGLALGVSSHSLWELCRARSLQPRYIACGPVWPTLTKAMPWRAQGLDNLSWWCRMAGVPVAAIGGILDEAKVRAAARCGADGICIVRGLGDEPRSVVPALQAAMLAGRADIRESPSDAAGPHPSLSAA